MHISFVEIQNFRKLKSVRIEFTEQKTLFVGPNNSGKTSAMVALRHFLIDRIFSTNDFTLSGWAKLNEIAKSWETIDPAKIEEKVSLDHWIDYLPVMDVWLQIEKTDVHYVRDLLPTLGWKGGLLGVRMRLEPEKLQDLFTTYCTARKSATDTLAAAKAAKVKEGKKATDYTLSLWPSCMKDFLDKEFKRMTIRSYLLDPTAIKDVVNGEAILQPLPEGSEPFEVNPFKKLIKIHRINAQRGFSDASEGSSGDGREENSDAVEGDKKPLGEQLRKYYSKHIDPAELPEPADVEALQAIWDAQDQFNSRLHDGFRTPFTEVEGLNYPGFSDPRLKISTQLKPMDGMKHASALQYEVIKHAKAMTEPPHLPEQYNGLGFQNLISMIFQLMSFRDDWMKVGKAKKKAELDGKENVSPAPLHLVLVEEPEAHLHVQVQQVFMRKAYEILRNNEDLKKSANLKTQLVVSTHSSHIAHECDYSSLRYFRRKPAMTEGTVPTTTIVNLSDVFGPREKTIAFVARYLRAMHCDLFFADAVIFVEGTSERMLVPHFIKNSFPELNHAYVTLLEVNGSHAQRFKPLIEHLGLTSLIITDLDTVDGASGKSVTPQLNANQNSSNSVLKSWIPALSTIDDLAKQTSLQKIKQIDPLCNVRVAYQYPQNVLSPDGITTITVFAATFETAIVLENLQAFKTLTGTGLIKKFSKTVTDNKDLTKLDNELFLITRDNGKYKAEFALDLLLDMEPDKLKIPTYIQEGLSWLQDELQNRKLDLRDTSKRAAA